MALTKGTQTVLDAWALTANGSVRVGAFLNVESAYSAKLFIKAALGEAVASTGQPEVIVLTTGVNADPSCLDKFTPWARYIGPVGTPLTPLAFDATEPVGETVIACQNPVTNNYDNNGKFKFVKNTTAANSEIIYQTTNSLDAGDTITIAKGLENEQTAAASTILDIDHATTEVVAQWTCWVDCVDLKGIMLIYNANYDTDGPDVYTTCQYILNTGV